MHMTNLEQIYHMLLHMCVKRCYYTYVVYIDIFLFPRKNNQLGVRKVVDDTTRLLSLSNICDSYKYT